VNTRIQPYLGHFEIAKLDADLIERWQNALIEGGYAPRSVLKARVVLSAIIKVARRRRLLRENPLDLIDTPSTEPPAKRAISGQEVTRLFRAIRGHRFETLLLAALLTGTRRGELLGWQWKNVDLDRGTVAIRMQVQRIARREGLQILEPKSKAGMRIVPLPAMLVRRLADHRAQQASERDAAVHDGRPWFNTDPETGDEMFVFTTTTGTPIEPRNYNRAFKALVASAGLDPLTPHELRHSMSTILMSLGVPPVVVSQLLGHADPSVTLRWYNHVIPESHRAAMDRLDDYMSQLALEA